MNTIIVTEENKNPVLGLSGSSPEGEFQYFYRGDLPVFAWTDLDKRSPPFEWGQGKIISDGSEHSITFQAGGSTKVLPGKYRYTVGSNEFQLDIELNGLKKVIFSITDDVVTPHLIKLAPSISLLKEAHLHPQVTLIFENIPAGRYQLSISRASIPGSEGEDTGGGEIDIDILPDP